MSRGFVIVGDTDYLSPALGSTSNAHDSRARAARKAVGAGATWTSSFGALLRAAGPTPRYVEFAYGGSNSSLVGLVGSGQEATVAGTYTGGAAQSCGYYPPGGTIYLNGGAVQSNLPVIAPGDVIGVLYTGSAAFPQARYILNGGRNLVGYSEDLGAALWTKANGATAIGPRLRFVNTNSYAQQTIASAAGGVGAQFVLSFYVTASHSTTFHIGIGDTDAAPFYTQAVVVVANVRQRVTLSATMGAGYSGSLQVQIYGNGVVTAGTTVFLEQLQINAGLVADEYQARSAAGGLYGGNAFSLTANSYRPSFSLFAADSSVTYRPDRQDQVYPYPGAQPWGAAARVSECGGYSPAASAVTDLTGASVLDSVFRRTHSTTGGAFGNAFLRTRSRGKDSGLYYVEWFYEALDSNDTEIGLAGAITAGYIGSNPSTWGYGRFGNTYYNGFPIASNPAWAYTTGDTIGLVWQPSTGKLWFFKNGVPIVGDPVAGTGASFINALGDLFPGSSIWQNGRIRPRTHALEQRHRPAYAEAWDGVDLVPECHYAGHLAEPVKYKREISVWPWGRGRQRGAPVGSIELLNVGGAYDALEHFRLLDQPVRGYTQNLANGVTSRVFAQRVDKVANPSLKRARILIRDRSSLLDVRADKTAVMVGGVVMPGAVVAGSHDYIVSHNPLTDYSVRDGGAAVTTWAPLPVANGAGFRRTVNPAKKSVPYDARTFRRVAKLTVTNGDFSAAWVGDNPPNWVVTETAPSNIVTQSGGACRFLRQVAGPTVSMRSATIAGVVTSSIFVKVSVTAYVKGSLTSVLFANGVAVATRNLVCGAGTGEYWYEHTVGGVAPYTIEFQAALDTDLSIDDVEVWTVDASASQFQFCLQQILIDLAGFTAADYALDTYGGSWHTGDVGFWSDERPTHRQIIDALCESLLVDWYVDAFDVLRFAQLPSLTTGALPDFALGPADILDEIESQEDGAPNLTDRLFSRVNCAVHSDGEIDGSVYTGFPAFAETLRKPGFEITPAMNPGFTTLDAKYVHAFNAKPKPTQLRSTGAGALTIYADFTDHWSIPRRFFPMKVRASAVAALRPGMQGTVTHPRYGLALKKAALVSIEGTFTGSTANILCWG